MWPLVDVTSPPEVFFQLRGKEEKEGQEEKGWGGRR